MKLRRKLKIKKSTIILLLCLIVFFLVYILINYFNQYISPNFMQIVEQKLSKESQDIITQSFNKELVNSYQLNDLLIINKNAKDEITTIDFDLDYAYEILFSTVKNIKDKLYANGDENGYIMYIPMGIGTKNIYFSNLGPKIPIKVTYLSTLSTSLSVSISNYGINNSLAELYLNINLLEDIIIPFSSTKINKESKILLATLLIEGSVPSVYGNSLNKDSSLLNFDI